MIRRILAELRIWEEVTAGLDDPFGDYLLELEKRVASLEADLAEMRKRLPVNGANGDIKACSTTE